MNFDVGGKIGDYKLLARCGQGAYGVVFLAENIVTGQRVALKVVAAAGRNCERELKGLRQYQRICRRTGLLQIYHVGSGEDFFYYTMDAADPLDGAGYIPKTLANILKVRGKLPAAEVRTMADELISALEALHKKGMMHRDIKPENILWVDDMAVPGDIGLITDSGQTTLAGTPGFIPQEVLAGLREYEEKDDFYALGKVLYCALTGLPAARYPSFPESSTLTGAGEIVNLYSRLCAGEPPDRPPRRRTARKIVYPAVLLCLSAVAFLAGGHWRRSAGSAATAGLGPPPEQPSPAESEPAYSPSPEMMKLLPELREHYRELESRRIDALGACSRKDVSAAELADAEKYLALHPENPLAHYPRAFVIDRRQQQAEADFDRKHRNDPVWRYFRNQLEISLCFASIRGQAFPGKYSAAEARKKLRELYRAQRTLETEILKKYRK